MKIILLAVYVLAGLCVQAAELHYLNAGEKHQLVFVHIAGDLSGKRWTRMVPAGETHLFQLPDSSDTYQMGVVRIDVGGVTQIWFPGSGDITVSPGYFHTIFFQDDGYNEVSGDFLPPDFRDIPAAVDVPGIGEVTLPTWATGNAEMAVFFLGLACAAGIRLIRAALRWFKHADATEIT